MVSRFGRYELVRLLGRGGMAEVFLARQRGLGGFEKRLVIKRVLPKLAQDPRFLRLFFEEARLHASLSHGNLVPIFDFGRVGNDYFLAMEFVEGCDLAQLLKAVPGRCLPSELVAYIGAELCHALQHVHRHRLVHRDLTPRNVLLSFDGEVKLTDFGIVQNAEGDGSVRGTVAYMAPEQARGESVEASADLYALGLIVAEAVTGIRVRGERSKEATEQDLQAADASHAVAIEGPFAALIARATAPLVADRFVDAGELASAFESIAAEVGGARASSARALAILVRACTPVVLGTGDVSSVSVPDAAPATYYRDATTAGTFVEEILAQPKSANGLPRRAIPIITASVAILAALATVALVRRSALPRAASTAADLATPVVAAPRVAIAPVPARPAVAYQREPADIGSLDVVCRPWCVVVVDGQRRGEDGRHHVVRLAAGRHRVVVQRLEDRQVRTVQISSDRTQSLDVVFD